MFWSRCKHLQRDNKMINKYFAGIGSRETPPLILGEMKKLAAILEKDGYTLRSGGAKGADTWFARGCDNAQIWLPWNDFNSWERNDKHTYKIIDPNDELANETVNKFHPVGSTLKGKVRLLMMRNTYQILGVNEPNSEFVICWTEGGQEIGGTSQAIRIARHYKIPVYNMFNLTNEQILKEIAKLNLLQ